VPYVQKILNIKCKNKTYCTGGDVPIMDFEKIKKQILAEVKKLSIPKMRHTNAF